MAISVSGLYTYPVKSCRGLSHDARSLSQRGFIYDREWMVVSPEGRYQTQREKPRMALVKTELTLENLILTAPGMPPLTLPLTVEGTPKRVTVWDDECDALDQGEVPGEWFSRFLGESLRLVRMTEEFKRTLDARYSTRPDAYTGFADAFPVLLISEASLADLNGRLPESIPMNRFRPNIIVKGTEPYEEDTWKVISIGDVRFDVVKPCSRCAIPTTNQDTAERSPEPTRTLLSYRPTNPKGSPYFGQNLVNQGIGVIRVGDPLEVLEINPTPVRNLR